MTTRLSRLTAAIALVLMLEGCLTYYVAKDDPVVRTELILLGSEVAIGAAFGTVVYLISNKSERLPLAGSIAVGIGAALVLDVAAAGIVAIVNCDDQDPNCKK